MENNRGLQGRLRVITTEGDFRWLDIAVTPLAQPGASLLSFDDSTEDIGAARRADELSRVLEATRDLVGILTPDGTTFVYLNEALAELLGETAKNSTFSTYVDPGAHELLETVAFPEVHTSGSWRGDLILRTITGGSMPVSAMLVAHVGNGGACEAISIVARDQTELRATQERLVESENRMHALVENSADLLVLLTACLLYTSPSPRDQRGSRMPSSA